MSNAGAGSGGASSLDRATRPERLLLAIGLIVASTVFFAGGGVHCYDEARKCDVKRFARYFNGLLERGILVAPSQFEAMFFSAAHTEADVAYFLDCLRAIVAQKDF